MVHAIDEIQLVTVISSIHATEIRHETDHYHCHAVDICGMRR